MKNILLILFLFLLSCNATKTSTLKADSGIFGVTEDNKKISSALTKAFRQHLETPYKKGGLDRNGIDDIGFVYYTFLKEFNLKLPLDYDSLMKLGREVPKDSLKSGDLLFFKFPDSTYNVAIYSNNRIMYHFFNKSLYHSKIDKPETWKKHHYKTRRIIKLIN